MFLYYDSLNKNFGSLYLFRWLVLHASVEGDRMVRLRKMPLGRPSVTRQGKENNMSRLIATLPDIAELGVERFTN